MPVPNSINELDTAAANNSPQGSETAKGNIDNYLRTAFAFIKQLSNSLAITNAATVQPGAIFYTAASSAPTGWLAADGSAVSRTTYAALFAAIGTTYGAGDGATTFNLPDLRGEFVRGLDSGRGVDTGRTLGSAQAGAIQSHNHTASTDVQGAHGHAGSTDVQGAHAHTVRRNLANGGVNTSALGSGDGSATDFVIPTDAQGNHAHNFSTSIDGNHAHNVTVNSAGGTETRPRNVALLAIIKT